MCSSAKAEQAVKINTINSKILGNHFFIFIFLTLKFQNRVL